MSSSKDLSDAMAAASLVDQLKIEDLDDVTEEILKAADEHQESNFSLHTMRFRRPIGLGGQGGVWLAEDSHSGLRYAVKQVRKGRLAALPRKSAMRVFTEKEALMDCRHPFITRLFGTFQDHSSLYFCLELMSGGDLFGLLDLFPTGVREDHARFYTATVALALRHIHSRGYVYRDVKLENVLIGGDGYVKLCDFGFAKCASESRTFTKCGTDEYAPPEVVSGKGRSTAADWWGLGVLLHEMLTGRPPFEGRSAQDIFALIEQYTRGGHEAAERLQRQVELIHEPSDCFPHQSSSTSHRIASLIRAHPRALGLLPSSRRGLLPSPPLSLCHFGSRLDSLIWNFLAQVSRTAENLSRAAGAFLIGLLRARETERIGCGPEGFLALQVR